MKKMIEEMVRDFTTVVPRPKSEVRRRLETLLAIHEREMAGLLQGEVDKVAIDWALKELRKKYKQDVGVA